MAEFWTWVEGLPLSLHIGETWWYPLLESIHVITAAFVLGSILMLDLRILGVAGRRYPVSRIADEIVPWTLASFVVSCVAGTGMFMTRASYYMANPAFQLKLAMLVLAGLNMLAFNRIVCRDIAAWDTADAPSAGAKAAGATSLVLWAGVMLAGRWIGHIS
jgi:hypothetical protein